MTDHSRPDPYERIAFRGVTVNRRTAAMLLLAEKRSGVQVQLAQGSYHPGVAASGTTHAGGGAVDVRCIQLTHHDRLRLGHALKDVGFAVWHRLPVPGLWGEHLHCIAIGDREASAAAKWQVVEYVAGRNGLTNRGPDRTYRPRPLVRFSLRRGHPVPLR